MDRTHITFNIILKFVRKHYNGSVDLKKSKLIFLEELDHDIRINAIPILVFLNDTNVYSIYRYIIENENMKIDELKKGVLEIYESK